MLKRHEMKRVSDQFYEPGMADFLVYRTSKKLAHSAQIFRDWLLNDIAKG